MPQLPCDSLPVSSRIPVTKLSKKKSGVLHSPMTLQRVPHVSQESLFLEPKPYLEEDEGGVVKCFPFLAIPGYLAAHVQNSNRLGI